MRRQPSSLAEPTSRAHRYTGVRRDSATLDTAMRVSHASGPLQDRWGSRPSGLAAAPPCRRRAHRQKRAATDAVRVTRPLPGSGLSPLCGRRETSCAVQVVAAGRGGARRAAAEVANELGQGARAGCSKTHRPWERVDHLAAHVRPEARVARTGSTRRHAEGRAGPANSSVEVAAASIWRCRRYISRGGQHGLPCTCPCPCPGPGPCPCPGPCHPWAAGMVAAAAAAAAAGHGLCWAAGSGGLCPAPCRLCRGAARKLGRRGRA
jgi:hypothetical protein